MIFDISHHAGNMISNIPNFCNSIISNFLNSFISKFLAVSIFGMVACDSCMSDSLLCDRSIWSDCRKAVYSDYTGGLGLLREENCLAYVYDERRKRRGLRPWEPEGFKSRNRKAGVESGPASMPAGKRLHGRQTTCPTGWTQISPPRTVETITAFPPQIPHSPQ